MNIIQEIRKMQEAHLFNAITPYSDVTMAKEIVSGSEIEDDPTWVKNAMKRLEENFNEQTIKNIRIKCQCGYAMDEKLKLINDLMDSSESMEEFAGNPKAKAAGLSYSDGILYLKFEYCPCPILSKIDKLDSNTWCLCTTGYSKVLFEKAFGCEVNVDLLQSIKTGDSVCLMSIIPLKPIFKAHSMS